MKLIASNNETVTLEMTRQEFHVLRDAATEARERLEANLPKLERVAEDLRGVCEEEVYDALYGALIDEGLSDYDSLEDLQAEIKRGQKLLPQIYDLSEALERITTEGDLARYL